MAELLVCEKCKEVVHTYCLEDGPPDGYIPKGDFICTRCAPYKIEDEEEFTEKGVYTDIWKDDEVMTFLKYRLGPYTSYRVRNRASNYIYDNTKGLLYSRGVNNLQRIVPQPEQREHIAMAAHDSLGHRGYRSVADALRPLYTWKGMRQQIKEVVNNCNKCQDNKTLLALKPLTVPGLQSIPQSVLLSRWTIDLTYMPESEPERYKYIAVAVESYSRTVVAAPLTDKKAPSVKQWFERDVIYKYGSPAEVQCDRGGEFMAGFKKMCKELNIKLTRGAPYHPQSQGLVERANKTLGIALDTYAGDTPRAWPQYLHKAVFSMNACKQSSTKHSPFYLLYGVDPNIPLHLDFTEEGEPWHELDEKAAEAAQINERIKNMEEAHTKAVKNLQGAQKRQADAYAKRTNQAPLVELPEPGGQVFVKKMRAAKGTPNKLGPYKFIKETERGVLVEDADEQREYKPRHLILVEPTGGEPSTKKQKTK